MIEHTLMKNINGVTQLRKGGFVVACDSGMHLLARSCVYQSVNRYHQELTSIS